ncbi:MAG: pyridoxamine 5'-phosphate oxidase family protein [Haloferacaceae archaeon]
MFSSTAIDDVAESDVEHLSDARIREFLTDRGVGVLGLPAEEAPYLLPMSFGYDGEGALYFVFLLFGVESRKETLSERAGRARFLVYAAESIHEWQSVSLLGRVEAVDDDGWGALRDAMENAWHPSLFSAAVPMRGIRGYRFRIEEWTGIASG